jgi:hypothetical protein
VGGQQGKDKCQEKYVTHKSLKNMNLLSSIRKISKSLVNGHGQWKEIGTEYVRDSFRKKLMCMIAIKLKEYPFMLSQDVCGVIHIWKQLPRTFTPEETRLVSINQREVLNCWCIHH